MSRFEVLLGEVVIGHTDLEMGDPAKGIVAGMLEPTSEYSSDQLMDSSKLSVRPSGENCALIGGLVTIEDYSADIGDITAIEVTVAGISEPSFRRFFPAHVAIYERQIRG